MECSQFDYVSKLLWINLSSFHKARQEDMEVYILRFVIESMTGGMAVSSLTDSPDCEGEGQMSRYMIKTLLFTNHQIHTAKYSDRR